MVAHGHTVVQAAWEHIPQELLVDQVVAALIPVTALTHVHAATVVWGQKDRDTLLDQVYDLTQILKIRTKAVQAAVQVVLGDQLRTDDKIIAVALEAITSKAAQAVCQIF
jgi:hypothetical protein